MFGHSAGLPRLIFYYTTQYYTFKIYPCFWVYISLLLPATVWYSIEPYIMFYFWEVIPDFERTISIKNTFLGHFLTPYNEKIEFLSEKDW